MNQLKLEEPLEDDPLEDYYQLRQIAPPRIPRHKGSDEVIMLGLVLMITGMAVLISLVVWALHR